MGDRYLAARDEVQVILLRLAKGEGDPLRDSHAIWGLAQAAREGDDRDDELWGLGIAFLQMGEGLEKWYATEAQTAWESLIRDAARAAVVGNPLPEYVWESKPQ
jgi:hypothetical protein